MSKITSNNGFVSFKANIKTFLKKKSIKDYYSVVLSQFAVKPITIIRSIVVAKYLGPNDYGLLKGVELISMLNKFGNMGFTQYAMREIGSIKNSGRENEESEIRDIRDTSYSSELLLITLLFTVCVGASIYAKTTLVSLAILLSGISMAINKVVNMLVNDSQIEQEFVNYSKIMFTTTVVGSILTIMTVPFWGIYATLVLPVFVGLFKGRLFFRKSNIIYRFKIKYRLLKKMFLVGTQLTLITLAYGSYKYSERIFIISFLNLKMLGFYGIADTILTYSSEMFFSAIRVRKMKLFERLGRNEYSLVAEMVSKETRILIYGAAVIVVFGWLLIEYPIAILLPKYMGATLVVKLLLLVLPFKVSTLYANAVLISANVNMQKYLVLIQITATVILAAGVYIANYYGKLTLTSFVVLDLVGYVFHNLMILVLYKKKFYDVFVLKNSVTI